MSDRPEFPLENLTKEELLKVLVYRAAFYFQPATKRLRQEAYEVRQQTLWDAYVHASERARQAAHQIDQLTGEERQRAWDAYKEASETGNRAYHKWDAFVRQYNPVDGKVTPCAP